MTSRVPDPADPFEEEGQASDSPGLAGKRITGDPQDDIIVPGDRPHAVDADQPYPGDAGGFTAEERAMHIEPAA